MTTARPAALALCLSLFLTPLRAQENPRRFILGLQRNTERWFAAGELEKAESDARQIAAVALDQLGAIYSALEEYELAVPAYRESCRVFPLSASPFIGLGSLHMRTGDYQEGMRWVKQILDLNPLHPGARHVLGKLHFLKGDFEQAAEQLRDALALDKGNHRLAYTLGLAYLKLQRPEEARRVFDSMIGQLGDSATVRILIGRAYREADYLREAVAEFSRAVELNPSQPRAHYYLGLSYLLLRSTDAIEDAIREFELELQASPRQYFAHFYLGVLHSEKRRFDKAMPYLERAIELEPENPDPYLYLGRSLAGTGRQEEAIELLQRSIELTTDPGRNNYQVANTHFVLGQILLRRGRRDEGRRHLERSKGLRNEQSRVEAIRIQSHMGIEPGGMSGRDYSDLLGDSEPAVILDVEPPAPAAREQMKDSIAFYRSAVAAAYQNLARACGERSDYKGAVRFLEAAGRWSDSLRDQDYNLALAHFRAGNFAEALGHLKAARAESPEKREVLNLLGNLALALVERRQPDLALETLAVLVEIDPGIADLYSLKGRALAQKGDQQEALAQFRRGLDLNPELPGANYSMGTILMRLGRMDEAEAAFDRELELDSDHAAALYHKGTILVLRRRHSEAVPLLEKAIRLDPGYSDAYYQLAKVQIQQGRLLQAVANLETAASLAPEAAHIFYQLYQAYRRSDRAEEAARALERYRELKRNEEAERLKRMQP